MTDEALDELLRRLPSMAKHLTEAESFTAAAFIHIAEALTESADALTELRERVKKAEKEEVALAAENDRLFAQVEALTRRVRELESAPVAEEVEAMACTLYEYAENPAAGGFVPIFPATLNNIIALLSSLSRQIAAKDADISARSDIQQAYLDCWRNERERAEADRDALRALLLKFAIAADAMRHALAPPDADQGWTEIVDYDAARADTARALGEEG